MSPGLVPRCTLHGARFIELYKDSTSRREGLLDTGASGRYKIREAWAHNFSFLAHASFHVPRWAIGLALNIKPSGIPVWQQEALVLLGLTSLPSGLICKESGGGRLKLDEAIRT